MVYKDYKINLKFFFSVCRINFRIQHHACLLIYHHITIHHNIFLNFFELPMQVFLSYHPLTFDLTHADQWSAALEVHPEMPYRRGVSEPKIIFLYPLMVSLIASSSSSFVFIQFQPGIFNFFASFNRDVLLIYL